MSRLTGFLGLVVAALLALHGCDHPYTQIIVSVDSDLPSPKVLESLQISVLKRSGAPGWPVVRKGPITNAQLPATLAITSSDGSEIEVEVTVEGYALGHSYVARTARARFKHDRTLLLRMDLLSSCVGVECSANMTCGENQCEAIDRGALPAYTGTVDKLDDTDVGPRDAGTPDSGHDEDAGADGSVPSSEQVVDLALGVDHTCALKASGSVYCWGSNTHYALGRPSTDTTCPESALCRKPGRVAGLHKAVAIAAGQSFTCALDEFDAVYCWGMNDYGQMGVNPKLLRDQPTPTKLADNVRELRLGRHFACVLRNDQTVSCWGDNAQNQLGQPSTLANSSSLTNTIETDVASLTLGSESVCALRAKGDIQCWGDNSMCELGTIKPLQVEMPAMFPPAKSKVTELAMGDSHICMLVSGRDHFVYCAGRAKEYELGPLNAVPSHTCYDPDVPHGNPNEVECSEKLVEIDLGATVYGITAGARFTCARIGDDGPQHASVVCWGANDSKQVERSDNDRVDTPAAVPVTTGVTLVRAGQRHACAVEYPYVWCWGANETGQLGPGADSTVTTSSPAKFKLPKDQ